MQRVNGLAVGNIRRRRFLENRDYADGQHAVTRCAQCKAYTRGRIVDGKRWFEQHMELKHDTIVRRKA